MPTLLGEESQRHVVVSWSLFSLLFHFFFFLRCRRRDSHEPGHERDGFELKKVFLCAFEYSELLSLVCGSVQKESVQDNVIWGTLNVL